MVGPCTSQFFPSRLFRSLNPECRGSYYLSSRLHVVVVLLLEEGSLDLGMLEQLKVAFCKAFISRVPLSSTGSEFRKIANPMTGRSSGTSDIIRVLEGRHTS